MKARGIVLAFAGVLALGSSAFAGIIFSDNFNTENGGVGALNFNAFTKWTISTGTVDLIGNGFNDFLPPGQGLYVDLDGSTTNAGTMTSQAIFLTAGNYQLDFKLAGSQRGGFEQVTAQVQVGLYSELFTLPFTSPLTNYTRFFSIVGPGQNVNIVFDAPGGDQIGLLLDDVVLSSLTSAVPLPPAVYPGLAMLAGLGIVQLRRRRKSAAM